MTQLYIGNLDLGTTEPGIRAMLAPFGEVMRLTLAFNSTSGESRAFAFVEMDTVGAGRAIEELDGWGLHARMLYRSQAETYCVQ